jgi:hypothetical protein
LQSNEKQSCERVAQYAFRLGAPFPQDLLVDLVKAAVRGGELKLFRYGSRFYLDSSEVSRWFNERVLPLSVYLSQNDYVRALRAVILGDGRHMDEIEDKSVHLTVTSPPYPMIEIWDDLSRAKES